LCELVQKIRQATGFDVVFEDGDHGHMWPVCSMVE
jgi:hypothetical protein